MYSQWVRYGLGPAYLNNSWGLWSFLLSWGPYRNGQGIGPWINEFFSSKLLSATWFLTALQLLPLCVTGLNPILRQSSWANSCGHHHRTKSSISRWFGAHVSSTLRWYHVLLGVCQSEGAKHCFSGRGGLLSHFLGRHRGLDVSSQQYGHGSLHLWWYKGKKFIVADAEIYKAPHCLAHPYLPIVGDTDIL